MLHTFWVYPHLKYRAELTKTEEKEKAEKIIRNMERLAEKLK